MHELRSRTLMMILALTAYAPMPAHGQEAKRVELTSYVALGSNGAAPIGAAIEFPLTPMFGVEADVAYRRAEGRLHALSMYANLICHMPRVGATTPYLAGGMGLAEYGTPIVLPQGGYPIGAEQLVTLTVNAGGGVKVAVDDKWGLRTDARWFKSFGRHASEHFRVAQGISFDVGKR